MRAADFIEMTCVAKPGAPEPIWIGSATVAATPCSSAAFVTPPGLGSAQYTQGHATVLAQLLTLCYIERRHRKVVSKAVKTPAKAAGPCAMRTHRLSGSGNF